MMKTIEGVFRRGKVELAEEPEDLREETRVLVTILDRGTVDLRARGIGEAAADDLRGRLAAFAAEWDSPENSIYDDYAARLSTR